MCSFQSYCPNFILQSTSSYVRFSQIVLFILQSTPHMYYFHHIAPSLFFNPLTKYSISPYCALFILQSTTICSLSPYCPLFILESTHDMPTLTRLSSLYSTINPRYVHFHRIALSLFYNPPTICSLSLYCPLFILQSTPRCDPIIHIVLSLLTNPPTRWWFLTLGPFFILQPIDYVIILAIESSLFSNPPHDVFTLIRYTKSITFALFIWTLPFAK